MRSVKLGILLLLKEYVFLILLTYWMLNGRKVETKFLFANRGKSKSQIYQDLHMALYCTQVPNSSNFFVEFGATDGVSLSNSHFVETELGWKGILAEPGKSWLTRLRSNRNAFISDKCVWRMSGEQMEFIDAVNPDLSGLETTFTDFHKNRAGESERYVVETVSLNDLLGQHNAPKSISFLSIDTEGSELEILRALDFETWQFDMIVCEHNFQKSRKEIKKLLLSHGYRRHLALASLWDDWYVRKV
jgi:FkbM family methyltransferase